MIDDKRPLVSLITVCYNSERTIEDTIKSVISQDYQPIEYIIVDGASTDSTIAIVEKYKAGVSKYTSEQDKGVYDAMNKGIKMASGDIVGILNSDDVFFSTLIVSQIVNAFETNLGIAAVYGNIFYFKDDAEDKKARTWITKTYYPDFFADGEVPPHPSLFVKKSVYDAIGSYFPDFKISSDYEWMLRAFKVHNHTPFFLDQFIVKMRVGGESTSSLKNVLIGNREVLLAWRMNNLEPPFKFWFLRIAKKILQFVNR